MTISGKNYINGKWVNCSLGTLDMIKPSYDEKGFEALNDVTAVKITILNHG